MEQWCSCCYHSFGMDCVNVPVVDPSFGVRNSEITYSIPPITDPHCNVSQLREASQSESKFAKDFGSVSTQQESQ